MPDASNTFKKVAQGGMLSMAGNMGGMFLQFLLGVTVIRILPPADFGRISLAYIVINMLVMLSTLGFTNSLVRFVAKFRQNNDCESLGAVTGNALLTTFVMSLLLLILCFGLADDMANAFNKPRLQDVLEMFMFMIPPLAVMLVLSAIFRGMENAKPQALIVDGLLNLSRVLLLGWVLLAGLGYAAVLGVYVISVWIAFAAYAVYTVRVLLPSVRLSLNWGIERELILFSLPLLGVGIMSNVMNWSGTLILGYYTTNADVGLFNAPLRLTSIIPVPLAAVVFLYLPVATRLIEGKAHDELEALYASASKWAFLLTLPLTLYILLDAEYAVTLLFGNDYLHAANLLRVLALGASLNTITGPNGMTLIAHGDTRSVFQGTVLAGAATIGLCALLVPRYGVMGAAFGTAMAQLVSNVFMSLVLFWRYRIHPFTAHYLKPVVFAMLVSAIVHTLVNLSSSHSDVLHLLLFLLIVGIAVLAPVLTHSVTAEDVSLIVALEHKIWKKTTISDWLEAQVRHKDRLHAHVLAAEQHNSPAYFPNLIIAGAPKCGTTALFDYLADHPQVCPSSVKETRYFIDPGYPLYPQDRNFANKGMAGYAEFFQEYRPDEHKICVEATPDYLYQELPLAVLPTLQPVSKIIFVLRKPSERVYSMFRFAKNNMARLDTHLPLAQFLELVEQDDAYLREYPLLRNCIRHGRYADYLPRWYEVFGREQVRVYLFEDMIADLPRFMKELAVEIGIDPTFYDHYQFEKKNESVVIKYPALDGLVRRIENYLPPGNLKRNAGKYYERFNITKGVVKRTQEEKELLSRLDSQFADANDSLRQLTGLNLAHWK